MRDARDAQGVAQGRVERRTRRQESMPDSGAEAMLLDPMLPEKQRARRRLIGAIVLVVAAILILPLVLDSHPKPVTSDIAIDLPGHVTPVAPASGMGTQAQPNAGVVSAASATATAPPAQTPAPTAAVTSPLTTRSAPTAASAPAASRTTVADTSSGDMDTLAATPGARFAVQLGVFASDADAHRWVTKLKAVGVPAYVERHRQADGSMRTLLRAGPFSDRKAAVAAIAKVRGAGLMANANRTQ